MESHQEKLGGFSKQSIIGNGGKIKFGLDKWYGDSSLKESFLTLFAITDSKDAWVVNMWEDEGDLGHWSPCFSRHFHYWKLEMVEAFLWRIQRHLIKCEMGDRMTWSISKSGKFSVKAFYFFLSPGVQRLF